MNKESEFQGASICPRCGKRFTCGMKAGRAKCWCADLPARLPVPSEGVGCYCPECLREIVGASAPNQQR